MICSSGHFRCLDRFFEKAFAAIIGLLITTTKPFAMKRSLPLSHPLSSHLCLRHSQLNSTWHPAAADQAIFSFQSKTPLHLSHSSLQGFSSRKGYDSLVTSLISVGYSLLGFLSRIAQCNHCVSSRG